MSCWVNMGKWSYVTSQSNENVIIVSTYYYFMMMYTLYRAECYDVVKLL